MVVGQETDNGWEGYIAIKSRGEVLAIWNEKEYVPVVVGQETDNGVLKPDPMGYMIFGTKKNTSRWSSVRRPTTAY